MRFSHFGLQHRVENDVYEPGYLFLPVVVVDDYLVVALEPGKIVPDESADLPRHEGNKVVWLGAFLPFEDEAPVADVAEPHEVEDVAEELSPRGPIHLPILFLSTDQRCGVDGMVASESRFPHMSPQLIDLAINGA